MMVLIHFLLAFLTLCSCEIREFTIPFSTVFDSNSIPPGQIHGFAAGSVKNRPVLLLHGARFSASTWQQDVPGTMRALEDSFFVIAIDIPGYGESSEFLDNADSGHIDFHEELLGWLLYHWQSLLSNRPPVIVTPSMSGRYFWPLLEHHSREIAAAVLAAPVDQEEGIEIIRRLHDEEHFEDREALPPFFLGYGSNDPLLKFKDRMVEALEGFPLVDELVFEGASHPFYMDQPEKFNAALITFLNKDEVKSRQSNDFSLSSVCVSLQQLHDADWARKAFFNDEFDCTDLPIEL